MLHCTFPAQIRERNIVFPNEPFCVTIQARPEKIEFLTGDHLSLSLLDRCIFNVTMETFEENVHKLTFVFSTSTYYVLPKGMYIRIKTADSTYLSTPVFDVQEMLVVGPILFLVDKNRESREPFDFLSQMNRVMDENFHHLRKLYSQLVDMLQLKLADYRHAMLATSP